MSFPSSINNCRDLHIHLNGQAEVIRDLLVDRLHDNIYMDRVLGEAHKRITEGWSKWGDTYWNGHPDMELLAQDIIEELADSFNYMLMQKINHSAGRSEVYLPKE